jgi:hypothetical protein
MSDFASNWYIVSQEAGGCLIVTAQELASYGADDDDEDAPTIECWGPFETRDEAIAKRVGLIRSGKCKPK